MTESLTVVILGLPAICAATTFAPRVGIAAPLLLVLAGIGVSFLPFVGEVEIEPDWILTVVLPPLLYSAAVSMPAMDFRREFTAIGGLSVVLVVLSAVLLGVFFAAVIPGLGLAWGIALGAIVSPTDAVATSIVKRIGVSGRITAVLEGESLLNDATALEERDPALMARLARRSRDIEAGVERLSTRLRRSLADIDYFLAEPLGWREGVVVVWAGMRGAVTLAAAQTLPEDAPQRSLLILIAFLVAAGSLILQGGTLPRVVKAVDPARERTDPGERERLDALLAAAAKGADGDRCQAIDTQRAALLDARDDGVFSAEALNAALAGLDAEEIGIELKA